jgi:hypothetical protein
MLTPLSPEVNGGYLWLILLRILCFFASLAMIGNNTILATIGSNTRITMAYVTYRCPNNSGANVVTSRNIPRNIDMNPLILIAHRPILPAGDKKNNVALSSKPIFSATQRSQRRT